ncbi:MAG: hypothetical protein GX205_05160 [Firmicutes bacterium]|nr:hypothetical protein [Bacillota bacterium]
MAGAKGSNQSMDALMKLLPGLIASYPGLMSMLGDQSSNKADLNQVMAAVPKIMERVREAEPEQLERLLEQFKKTIPGLEDVLPKK